jgi:hypothetical protein
MSAIITDAAKADVMRDVLREACTLRLYVNDVGSAPTSGDFVEPEGGGYAPKAIRADQWDTTSAPVLASYPLQLWHFTRQANERLDLTVRGYFLTRNSDGRLRWFDPLPGGPMRIVNDGDQLKVSMAVSFAAAPVEG